MSDQPSRRHFLTLGAATLCLTPARAFASKPAEDKRARLKTLIRREARDIGVSSALALAVAHAESNFDPYAISPKGALGLMQIMPLTALSEYGIEPELLWNPRINTRLGLHFLRRLLVRYKGRVDLALSYYNGGSAVGNLPNARVIPATRNYVRKVQKYRAAYGRKIGTEDESFGYRIAGKPLSGRK